MPELHHKYGPSSLKYRALCPGWVNDETSDKSHADHGTRLHKAIELEDTAGLPAEDVALVNQLLAVTHKLETGADKVYKEVRLNIFNGLTFGTADRLIKLKRLARVVDYKLGKIAVDDAEGNLQGWAYTLGAFDLLPDVDEVEVWFLQPRIDYVSFFRFKRSDYNRLALAVKTVIDECERFENTQDSSLLKPSYEACLYCGRTCPIKAEFALAHVRKYEPEALEVVDNVHSSQITDPSKMAKLLTAAKVLERMVESVKKHALALALEQGGTLDDENGNPAYEVKERAGDRSLNLGLGLPILCEHLDDRELLSVSKVSLAGALKLISAKAPRGQKGKLIGAIEKQLSDAGAVSQGDGSRYLRKISVKESSNDGVSTEP